MNDAPDNRSGFGFTVPTDRDRLAELGRIAGGLVHELKNPVGVILLNAELMQNQISPSLSPVEREREAKRLRRIVDAARNIQGVVQSFLSFARPGQPDPDAVDVNGLLRTLLDEQAEALESAKISVSFHPDDNLALLAADMQHLRSIFLNIITNAREALIARPDDRRLLVVTRSAPQLVRVVIANNGPPFDERVAAHLFQPFTSSKDEGTGLGLAIVQRLVELHHGTVTASSDKAQGVSFTLEFPTDLGPAKARTELPMPSVEAQVRDDCARSSASDTPRASPVLPDPPVATPPDRKKRRARATANREPRTAN
ncbi:MAG TPA: HAMP domain-containing sensor histidine kinase [Planctomycetota bacterium]|nr:HAMP domain-containing sensor histidine kinase [Planctomycetota bacterium]